MSEIFQSFAEWAWARHHNVLSWYIRPLFLLPYCFFAYRRSLAGIAVTLVALLTSMFWFPVPDSVSPAVVSALAAEKEYLLGPWNLPKVLLALLIPSTFWALAQAFWQRSFLLGLVVVNAMVVIKIVWTFVIFDRVAALAHLVPAVLGLLVINLGVGFWLARRQKLRPTPAKNR